MVAHTDGKVSWFKGCPKKSSQDYTPPILLSVVLQVCLPNARQVPVECLPSAHRRQTLGGIGGVGGLSSDGTSHTSRESEIFLRATYEINNLVSIFSPTVQLAWPICITICPCLWQKIRVDGNWHCHMPKWCTGCPHMVVIGPGILQ